jgi:tetratricopeptide (TPR) repeat protein
MSIYLRLLIVVFCLSVPVRAPDTPDKPADPQPESRKKAATVAEKKQTLSALLSSANNLRRSSERQKAVLALNEAGHLQLDLSMPHNALETFQQSRALVESLQGTDPITTIDTLNGLASAYVAVTDCKQAVPLLEDARASSEQNNYPAGKAEALLLLSQCQNIKNRALALDTASEALSLWQSVGNGRGVVRSYLQIGQSQMAQTMLVEATESFQTALENARTLDDPKLQAESFVYLGYVAFRKGAWQQQLNYFADAEYLIDGAEEPYLMGQITSGLADALIETGSLDVGLQKSQEALGY